MDRPNILVVAIDTLRRDHLGCYGWRRPTSPNIDELAAAGTVFDNVFVNHYPTSPSFTTLLTGMDGIDTNIVQHGGGPMLSPKIPVLAERLKAAGYTTAAVDNLVTMNGGRPGWFARGYDFYHSFCLDKRNRKQTQVTTSRATSALELLRKERFFLMVHFWDPHIPYLPPEEASVFPEPRHLLDAMTLREQFTANRDAVAALQLETMQMNDVSNYEHVVSQYDAGVWNADRHVGLLIRKLHELDIAKNTLVVVLADHGECFGEFSVHFDHHGPSDANTRIPVLFHLPGVVPEGKRVSEYAQQLDVTSTLLEIAGVPIPEHFLGKSMLSTRFARDFVVSAECTKQVNWVYRTKDWKLVRPGVDLESGLSYLDMHGRPRDGSTLHDMRGGEGGDVKSAHPEVFAGLDRDLTRWLDARLAGKRDPLDAQGPSITYEGQIAKLRGLIRQSPRRRPGGGGPGGGGPKAFG